MDTKNLNIALEKSGELIVRTLVRELGRYGLGDSDLAKNIKYELSGDILVVEMPQYGEYLDKGTRPHMPPVDAIEKWSASKGLNAWAVAINIKKYGTKAKPFLHSITKALPLIDKLMTKAAGEDIEAALDGEFDKIKKK